MGYILFAEDDSMSRNMIRETLELLGYAVHVAENGAEALALALADRPALLLLDVLMPAKSGLEVTQEVKAHYGADAPPIILITALGSLQDVEQGKLSGADDYLIKPFSRAALLAKVRQAIG